MKTPPPLGVGLAALGLVVAAVIGAGCAAVLLAPSVPPTLDRASPSISVPVMFRSFTDERKVDVAVTPSSDIPLPAPTAGRVTSWSCQPGETFTSGTSNVAVDGRSVLNLATNVPLWRDLRVDDRGEDVRALQNELARLGFGVEVDGVLGVASLEAIHQLMAGSGVDPETSAIVDARRVLWLPQSEAVVTECSSSLSAIIGSNDVLAEVAGEPLNAAVLGMPEDLLPGPRSLRIDDIVVVVDEKGVVTSPEDRSAIATTASYRAGASESASPKLTGSVALLDPIQVASIPPSSVYDLDGSNGCVLSTKLALPARIVGSQLGQSFVVFGDNEAPASVAVQPNEDAPACR